MSISQIYLHFLQNTREARITNLISSNSGSDPIEKTDPAKALEEAQDKDTLFKKFVGVDVGLFEHMLKIIGVGSSVLSEMENDILEKAKENPSSQFTKNYAGTYKGTFGLGYFEVEDFITKNAVKYGIGGTSDSGKNIDVEGGDKYGTFKAMGKPVFQVTAGNTTQGPLSFIFDQNGTFTDWGKDNNGKKPKSSEYKSGFHAAFMAAFGDNWSACMDDEEKANSTFTQRTQATINSYADIDASIDYNDLDWGRWGI